MPAPFELELITPEQVLYSGPAEMLSVAGVAGSLGILAHHAPLLTELKPGEAKLTEPGGGVRRFYVGGGFLQVLANRVSILAEDAATAESLDLAEAERRAQTARDRLEAATDAAETAAARLEHDRAQARVMLARRHGR